LSLKLIILFKYSQLDPSTKEAQMVQRAKKFQGGAYNLLPTPMSSVARERFWTKRD